MFKPAKTSFWQTHHCIKRGNEGRKTPTSQNFAYKLTAITLALTLLLSLCAAFPVAHATTTTLSPLARELTKQCTFATNGKHAPFQYLTDGSYQTAFSAVDGMLQITAPEGEYITTLYLCFADQPKAWELQAADASGAWQVLQSGETAYAHVCVSLPALGVQSIRIKAEGTTLALTEVRVFSEGALPADVQKWEPTLGKADLLLLVGHPDDEFIFFGGLIPWYVAQHKRVLVAYMTCRNYVRRAELLNGLWAAGVRSYPVIGDFRDRYERTLQKMYDEWGSEAVDSFFIKLIRAHQPDVLVTHATGGEYGHGAHRVCADVALRLFDKTADPLYMPQHANTLGTWQVKKLYLHLYTQNVVHMDWSRKIGSKTANAIAKTAFSLHVSQQHFQLRDQDSSRYSSALFGLAKTTVGADEKQDDFFEHIPPNSACTLTNGTN